MHHKRLFPVLFCIILFTLLSTACKLNKLHCGAFSYTSAGEATDGNYVELNDGSKIVGKDVGWNLGVLSNNQVKVDNQKFKISEVYGVMRKGVYHIRKGTALLERFIHGKINVYYYQQSTTTMNSSNRSETSQHCSHYAQIGDRGELVGLAAQGDIKKVVSDCPLAVSMADKSGSQIRKELRNNRKYLNDIFLTYNRGCK